MWYDDLIISTTNPLDTTQVCGNGVTEGDEVCDDGNVLDTDCCGSTCYVQNAAGTSCNDGTGACDAAGACLPIGVEINGVSAASGATIR